MLDSRLPGVYASLLRHLFIPEADFGVGKRRTGIFGGQLEALAVRLLCFARFPAGPTRTFGDGLFFQVGEIELYLVQRSTEICDGIFQPDPFHGLFFLIDGDEYSLSALFSPDMA